ncbi:hypothetical protein KY289_013403 [Solanum tuberosum]|nr:hypothetical protein KY289_013403 [Solanum tuberosum]
MELLDDGGIQTTVREVKISLSEESLGIILGVPSQGIMSVERMVVLRSEKKTMASAADLFLMEKLDELEAISLPGIMLEHMHRVMTWKSFKHGIPYEYLLNHVFEHFGVPFGIRVPGTVKQMFSAATLLECECAEDKVKAKSHVSELLEQQEALKCELNDFTTTLSTKEVEIARLRA